MSSRDPHPVLSLAPPARIRHRSAGRFRGALRPGLILILAACSSPAAPDPAADLYDPPPALGDGLGGAHAAERGVDVAGLEAMLREIDAGMAGEIHSALVWRRGDLILERYWPGTMMWDGVERDFDRATRHDVFSVSKSVTATAVGLALAEGALPSLDTPALDLVDGYDDLAAPPLRGITLRHLLTMTAGLRWDELSTPYGTETNDHTPMNRASDPLAYLLSRPLAHEPGTTFVYNSGLTHLLGQIVREAVGRPIDLWLAERLFAPMGIDDFWWYAYPNGLTHAGGGLHLRPRDMMKFGVLHLRDGVWGGTRLLPAGWVAEATARQAPGIGYGYQWWRNEWRNGSQVIEGYSAQGWGGQFVLVIPDREMVVVFTGANRGEDMFAAFGLVERHLLPAAVD